MSLDAVLDLLRCPHCREPLDHEGRTVRCPNRHAYDLARGGHLNLLGRAAPAHADTAAMVAARERFLATTAYAPVADALTAAVVTGTDRTDVVLDVGAGTGYYLTRLLERTGGRGVALDISAYAARRAARAHDRIGAVVADAWAELPLPSAAVDVVTSVFAPRNPAEFARVLRADGVLAVVAPLPEHLAELRSTLGLLDVEPGKQERLAASLAGAFTPGASRPVRSLVTLPRAAVVDLVAMGPNAFHHDPDALSRRVDELTEPVPVSVAVTVSVWHRRTGSGGAPRTGLPGR